MIMRCMDQPLYLLVTCLIQALCQGLFLVRKWCDPCAALWHCVVVTEDTVHVCTGDVRPRYIVAVGSQDCQGLLPSFLIRSCCFSYAIHKHLDLLSRTI